MYFDLENQIKNINNFSEEKNLDQETKDFIFKLVEFATRAAAKRDICNIAFRMYNEGVDTYHISNYTEIKEEDLINSTYSNKFSE